MLRPYISGCLLPTSRDAGSVVATRRHRDRGRPGGGRSAGRRVARVRLPAGGALAPARHPHPHRSRAAVGRDRPRHGGSEACWCVARGGGRQPGGAPAARRVDRAIGVRRLRRGRRRAGACRRDSHAHPVGRHAARAHARRDVSGHPHGRRGPGAPGRSGGAGSGAALPAAPLRKPGVLVLEWLDPPYVAGHWVPELVALAGGQDVGSAPGERSRARPWEELAALAPDVVVVALCGFDIPRAQAELGAVTDGAARTLLGRRVEFLDGNAYTSRPGPRLVDAAETLARLIRG